MYLMKITELFSDTKAINVMCIATLLLVIITNSDAAERYRIGYFEGGEFHTYQPTYQALRNILHEQNWGDDKIEFVADAHFSPGFDAAGRQQWNAIAQTLLSRDDLDMIVLGGTAATGVMLRYSYPEIYCQTATQHENLACQGVLSLSADMRSQFTLKPLMAASVSDAVKAGFVPDQNSHFLGVDMLMVRIVPERYSRMFRIFHDEVQFTKLGLLYQDTPNGHTYTNLEDAHMLAKQRGFTVIEQTLSNDTSDAACQAGLQQLISQGIDAFFIPSLTCFEWSRNDVPTLLKMLLDNQVKTFARQGPHDVKAGAMMSLSSIDFRHRGNFLAERIIKVISGELPRNLIMVDDSPPKIALNLAAAQHCGHDFSLKVLGASNEIYREIVLPK